ncbi:HAD family phosphatase [Candidatus Bathyarchaeota archaeon]|nr:HAD family phosphatase [Candidatus Bathyarchaeota archaeon]
MTVSFAILDMDGTLLSKRSIDIICERFGLVRRLREIDLRYADAPRYLLTEKIGELFAGMNVSELEDAFDSIPLSNDVEEFIAFLKELGFIIAVATDSYKFLADRLKNRLRLDLAYGNILEVKRKIITGRVSCKLGCLNIPGCRRYSVCKLRVLKSLKDELGGLSVAVGDGDSDYCMFKGADISIAYRPKTCRLIANASTTVQEFGEAIKFLKEQLQRG